MNNRSYYSAPIAEFIGAESSPILGDLAQNHQHNLEPLQKNAWLEQIEILQSQFALISEGYIFFEFSIPRMGKRADVIFIYKDVVFVIEFKVGSDTYHAHDRDQVVDYALDLKYFHEGSHEACIVPILVATEAPDKENTFELSDDLLAACLFANKDSIAQLIHECHGRWPHQRALEPVAWAKSRYKPTPTIVQAAQALYRGHKVEEISRSEAGATNLTVTAGEIGEIIERSKRLGQKSICFITGVPGAGKTLAGLNITTERMRTDVDEHAVFLSGNGPLVEVLREALAREKKERDGISKKEARQEANTFIQNIHHFRDDNLETDLAPVEKVVVFDEAQRAWDKAHTAKFMRQKRDQAGFDMSEPEFLIKVMDRHDDWCVIIALIGGGQEINTGEAGLPEWFSALRNRFNDWHVYYSQDMDGDEYTQGGPLKDQLQGLNAVSSKNLHLAVSVRSFRAEKLSEFVHYLIANESYKASALYDQIKDKYPIVITRELAVARQWIRSKARGGELFGLVASSGGIRLKPYGVNVKSNITAADWFLNGRRDVRACQYLEDVATEFDIQGLELDWCGVCWDGDLRYIDG
ncbi:MAG: DUF2075 domain-containing protein, partial [Nitrosomonadaceae bacterium]|nr:DUF2075 domain-containing protein [Nitrosomonadaceae bacterium]